MTRELPVRMRGFSLLEFVVASAILAVVMGLLLPALLRAREAAQRVRCRNHLKQMGLALHHYHDVEQTFPHAYDARALFVPPWLTPAAPPPSNTPIVTQSWANLILPFLEQDAVYTLDPVLQQQRAVQVYQCPSDRRASSLYKPPYPNASLGVAALTDYLAVTGTMTFVGLPKDRNRPKCDGVIYENARTRIADITDGTSHTILVGERPPSPNLFWGWWTWSAFDASLGVRNTFYVYTSDDPANPGSESCSTFYPEYYRQGHAASCDAHHFWSRHPGGAQWLFADGSVRFLPYEANPILPALATRAGGEAVDWGSE